MSEILAEVVPLVMLILVFSCIRGDIVKAGDSGIGEVGESLSFPTIFFTTIMPSKVSPGDVMTVDAEVIDAYGMESVEADMGGIETVNLELVDGDSHKGLWRGVWNVHNTEIENYTTRIVATNSLGLRSWRDLTWSDPITSESGKLKLITYVSKNEMNYGESLPISGNVFYDGAPIETKVLVKINGKSFEVPTNNFGAYSYKFTPDSPGDYTISIQAKYKGYATEGTTQVKVISTEPAGEIKLIAEPEKQKISLGEPIKFSGNVYYDGKPLQVPIIVKINSEEFSTQSDSSGHFTFSYKPKEIGKYTITIQASKEGKITAATQVVTVVEVTRPKESSQIPISQPPEKEATLTDSMKKWKNFLKGSNPKIFEKNNKYFAKLELDGIAVEFQNFEKNKANWDKTPVLTKNANIKNFISSAGFTLKDFIWVDSNGFLNEWDYDASIILPSTYSKVFYCTGSKENPDCFFIQKCSYSSKPCYEEVNGKTIVFSEHFSGGGGGDSLHKYDYTTGVGTDRWAFHTNSSAGNDLPPANPWARDLEFPTSDYDAINSSDDSRATTSGGSSTINPAQIFEIQVSENRSTITQLDFYWEGYGDAGSPSFYVWNWTTSSWENLGSHSQATSDGIITATRSSGIEGYVNASGYIELTSVDTDNKPNFIKTDYIYINVTFQVTNSPPKWSNNQSSVPTVYNSNFISLFNVTWADDSDSNGYNFSWFESNFTGSPNNYTAFRFTGTNISSWNGTLPAGTFYWKFHANDSDGKWNSTDKWTFTIGKAPTETHLYLNGTEDNKTYNKNDVANFTIVTNASGRDVELWTDYPDRIYKFWNSDVEPLKNLTTLSITGLFKWVGNFSGDQNFSFSLKTWYTNITGSDTTSPNWFDNSTNSTASSMPVEHRIKWTDNTGLEGYIFSFDNCTGALENITEGTLSGTEDWSNVTVVTNSTGGCTIRWKVFANDSSGNWKETDVFSYQTSVLTTEILFPTQQFTTNTTSGKFLILDVDVSNGTGDIESGVNFNVNLSNSTISTTATINSQSYNSTKGNWEVNITTPSLTDGKWYNLWVNATYQSFYDEDEELTAIYYGQDIIPPITRNQGENSTAIGEGDSITLFAQGRDAMGLDWALLATNETGEWENKTKNQIIYDGFESGNFEAGGWTADPPSGMGSWQVTDSGTYSTNSGQYSATSAITGTYSSGNYTLWEANDTTGFQDIQVQYAFSYSTFACGTPSTVYDNFDFYVEYSTDGGTNWILLDSDSCGLSSIPWETRGPFTLPKSAENNPNFRIRFIAHISGANACGGNRVQIDDVNITGNGERIVFSGEKTWEWSNFTWYNFSIPAPKTIAWKIWYSDISGNINSTDIMTFYIEQSPKVDKPVTFNNRTLQEKTVFIRNSEITIRVNVTDPDGRDDIDKVWIKILNTTDNVKLDNTLMTNISTITNGYTYEYNYTIPSDADYGLWSLYTYSNDSANVIKFNSTTFQVKYKEAPIQSNWLPANGSNRFISEFNVTLNLDENGDCKWSTAEYDYDQMTNDCTGDNTQIITCPLSGLSEGSNDIYIACNDTEGNYDNSSENTHLLYNVNTTWFNTSFNYRREILINSTTNEEDYQVKIVFNDSNINYSHTSGNDLRFFNYTGNELNYWIEKWNESGDSVVWVRVPELNYTYNKTTYIIVYYNNSIVQTKSNGTLSFPYFDDWKENNTDDWEYNGATDSYLNNHHQWTENTTNFTKYREIILFGNFLNWWSGNYDHSNIGWCANKTYFRGGEDYVSIYFEHKVNNGANDTHIFVKLEIGKDGNKYTTSLKSFPKPSTTDNISIYLKYYSDYIGYEVRNADTGELIISDYIDNSSKIPDPSNVPYLFQHTWDYTPNMGGPSFDWVSPTYVDIYNYDFNGGMQLRIDYWFIKKYTYPEPTTIIGSEQFQSLNNPPTYSQDSDDSGGSVSEGTTVNIQTYWEDNEGLNTAIFRTNESGTWQNVSSCSLSGTGMWCNKTIDTSGDGGKTICWNEWANDTTGNWNINMGEHCFYVSQVYECNSCTDCSNKISSASAGDVVRLNTSIIDFTGTCINIYGKNNITFDCDGYTLDGTKGDFDYGIYINSSNYTEIKNCIIKEWWDGIQFLSGSNNNTIKNNIINSNMADGIYGEGSSGNLITNNTFEYNKIYAIYL
ncbi:MAG: DUF2341 domain-containing protein, partial [Candidatus Aenigmarchaeota archaeon]|nr:DUF2341 domain-containing protein [Candidatus Aenigmarchaeota archaeon]